MAGFATPAGDLPRPGHYRAPVAHRLTASISDSLWQALQERARTSGHSVSYIVQAALAEALDVQHHSIFQVSTSGAIVEGLYQGCVSVADLRLQGDVGLGTFEDLDGELIMIDGRCYQARSDGSVIEAPDTALTPFATVVSFAPDARATIRDVTAFDDFTARIDGLRTSANGIVSFLVTGTFTGIRVRAACRTEPGIDLVTATANQRLFDFAGITGTLVGFWCPEYTKSIAITGYHVHFISDDRQHGGHVLDLRADTLDVQVNEVSEVRLAIPETAAFLQADLSGDHSAALEIAERSR